MNFDFQQVFTVSTCPMLFPEGRSGFTLWHVRLMKGREQVFEERHHKPLHNCSVTSKESEGKVSDVPSSIFLMSYFKLSYLRRRVSFFKLS